MKYNYYPLASEAARSMIQSFLAAIENNPAEEFHIAISGGQSPTLLFDIWACEYMRQTPWDKLQFYWVDERCVPHDTPESNYGLAKRVLFDRVNIPSSNLHPIECKDEPDHEANEYSSFVKSTLPLEDGVPVFDFIFLGVGMDGHTSSIFLGQKFLLSSPEPYSVSLDPYKGQYRISLTGQPLLKARHTWFFVTGKEKENIVTRICTSEQGDLYPAGYIYRNTKDGQVFTDIPLKVEAELELSTC